MQCPLCVRETKTHTLISKNTSFDILPYKLHSRARNKKEHEEYVSSYIIQIWIYHESNVEFYGSEATLLMEVKLKSILLLKIHKTHIARHHM